MPGPEHIADPFPNVKLRFPKSSQQSLSYAAACVRPIGAPATQTYRTVRPGATALQTLGYFRLPPAPAARSQSLGTARQSITHSWENPSAFLYPPSALPPSKRSKGGRSSKERAGKEKGPVGGFTTRGNNAVKETVLARPHSPLTPHQTHSTLHSPFRLGGLMK